MTYQGLPTMFDVSVGSDRNQHSRQSEVQTLGRPDIQTDGQKSPSYKQTRIQPENIEDNRARKMGLGLGTI